MLCEYSHIKSKRKRLAQIHNTIAEIQNVFWGTVSIGAPCTGSNC